MADIEEDTMEEGYEYRNMTTAEVVEKLEEAWQNEKLAPDLLNPVTDLVECILKQIKATNDSLSMLPAGDMVCGILKLEIDRVKFIVCSYLRTRLQKIERYVKHYLENPTCLSPEELKYAEEFDKNLRAHFKEVVLDHLPTNFQDFDKKKAVSHPNMNKYIFMRSLEREESLPVTLDGDETMSVDVGTQLVLPYQVVSSYIKQGSAKLV